LLNLSNKQYDTMIVFLFDKIYSAATITVPPFFRLLMSDEVNTFVFHSKAFAFFKEQYGLNFDPVIGVNQPIEVDKMASRPYDTRLSCTRRG
jgi:hypothetical protein